MSPWEERCATWTCEPKVSTLSKLDFDFLDRFSQGSVFGWYIDRVVEIVHEQLGKRPNMWSPLSWDPASPPRKLVSSNAILNLWTGNLQELAYNITLSGTNDVVTSAGWYLPAGDSYTVDPASFCETDPSKPHYCTQEQRSRIIGGEACMW